MFEWGNESSLCSQVGKFKISIDSLIASIVCESLLRLKVIARPKIFTKLRLSDLPVRALKSFTELRVVIFPWLLLLVIILPLLLMIVVISSKTVASFESLVVIPWLIMKVKPLMVIPSSLPPVILVPIELFSLLKWHPLIRILPCSHVRIMSVYQIKHLILLIWEVLWIARDILDGVWVEGKDIDRFKFTRNLERLEVFGKISRFWKMTVLTKKLLDKELFWSLEIEKLLRDHFGSSSV